MKFGNLLKITLLIICTNFICSSFDILVYGDIGQFEEFLANSGSTSKDSTIFILNQANGQCTKPDNTNLVGLKNFQGLFTTNTGTSNNFICQSNQIVILGDISYTEVGKNLLMNTTSSNYPGFKNRLICLWINFIGFMKSINYSQTCSSISKNPLLQLTLDGRYMNLVIVTGNHSFDVDYDVESQQIASYFANSAFYFDGLLNPTPPNGTAIMQQSERNVVANDLLSWPSISTRNADGVKVEFLDYQPYPIYCYLSTGQNASNYQNCYYPSQRYGIFPSFNQSQNYTNAFIQALNSFTSTSDHRVLRAHNPIFNVFGPSDEMNVFYNTKYDGTNTLLDLMKQNKVTLLLASHNHMSQIQLFPYSQISNLYNKVNNPNATQQTIGINQAVNVDGSSCTNNTAGACVTGKYLCYYNDMFLGKSTINYNCSVANPNLTINLNFQNPSYLPTLISGNSGRKLDLPELDQRTAANVIFERGVAYGGIYINFLKTAVNISFFEQNSIVQNVIINNSPYDNYPIMENYVKLKIAGNLPTPFNYSQYNVTSSSWIVSAWVFILIVILI